MRTRLCTINTVGNTKRFKINDLNLTEGIVVHSLVRFIENKK
jgi:hypothetical protein